MPDPLAVTPETVIVLPAPPIAKHSPRALLTLTLGADGAGIGLVVERV